MGQKEMGAGRQQGCDTKAKTHELRGGQMGTGEETAGGTRRGKGPHLGAAVGPRAERGPIPAGLPSPPILPRPPLPRRSPPSPLVPPAPLAVPSCIPVPDPRRLLLSGSIPAPFALVMGSSGREMLLAVPPRSIPSGRAPPVHPRCPGAGGPPRPGVAAAGLRAAPSRRCGPSERTMSPVLFN